MVLLTLSCQQVQQKQGGLIQDVTRDRHDSPYLFFFILDVYGSMLYQEQNFNQQSGGFELSKISPRSQAYGRALSLPLLESDQVSVPALIASQVDTS